MRHLIIAVMLGTVIYVTDNGLVVANKAGLYNQGSEAPTMKRFNKSVKQVKEKPGITGPLRMMLKGAGYNH